MATSRATKTSLSELQRECHAIATESGWHDPSFPTRSPGDLLMLAVGELAEAMEEIRNGLNRGTVYNAVGETGYEAVEASGLKPEGFPIELADCIIRLLDTAEEYGIPLEKAINLKNKYNRTRPYPCLPLSQKLGRHGGKAL